MTRKEEIYQKAEELYQDVYPSSMAQRHGMEQIDRSDERKIFIQAATWADEHPQEGLVNLDSICGWIITHISDYVKTERFFRDLHISIDIDNLIKDLHKAMKE